MPFQPGNTEGSKSKRQKPFADALRIEAAALDAGQIERHPKGSLRWNAQRLLLNGEQPSIKELADRLDGKVPQGIGGDDELPPVQINEVKRLIVDPQLGNPDSEGV